MGDLERLATIAIDCGFKIHCALGPGLLESVYEVLLADSLAERGLSVDRQKPIPITFNGRFFDEGFRADLLVEGRLRPALIRSLANAVRSRRTSKAAVPAS